MVAESGQIDLFYGPRQEETWNFMECLLEVIGIEPACVIPGMKLFETQEKEKVQTIVEIQSDGSYVLIAEQVEAEIHSECRLMQNESLHEKVQAETNSECRMRNLFMKKFMKISIMKMWI